MSEENPQEAGNDDLPRPSDVVVAAITEHFLQYQNATARIEAARSEMAEATLIRDRQMSVLSAYTQNYNTKGILSIDVTDIAAPRTALQMIASILQGQEQKMSPQTILLQMQRRGWTTTSKDPLNLVRTQLSQLRDRTPEVAEFKNSAGKVFYQWVPLKSQPEQTLPERAANA